MTPTITLPRAVVERALEALGLAKLNGKSGLHPAEIGEIADAITALRAALAQQAEPVEEPAPMPPFPPISQWKLGCAVCGIGADGNAYGYVCSRYDCPTKVTCGGTV